MGTKNKVLKSLAIFSGIILCLSTGFFIGKNGLTNPFGNNLDQAKLSTDIAVVNLDSGIKVNDEMVNYGTQLVKLPNSNWSFTSLEDARRGLEEGKYAAYLLIPNTFSERVNSINTTPTNISLEYAVGDKLPSKEKEQVIYDVLGFGSNLNNDLSGLYLSSIMKEFHNGQDNALYILDQDKKDLNTLLAVQGYDLVELVKLPEAKVVENKLVPLDLGMYSDKNSFMLEDLYGKYAFYLNNSNEDLQNTKTTANETITGMNGMFASLNELELIKGTDGTPVYETGVEELIDAFYYDDASQSQVKKQAALVEVENLVGLPGITPGSLSGFKYTAQATTYPAPNFATSANNGNSAAKVRIESWKQSYDDYRDALLALKEEIDNGVNLTSADVSQILGSVSLEENTADIIDADVLFGDLNQYIINEYQPQITAAINNEAAALWDMNNTGTVTSLNNIKTNLLGINNPSEANDIKDSLNATIKGVLDNKATSEKTRLLNDYSDYGTKATVFQTALDQYDPLSYIKQDEVDEIKNLVGKNISSMDTEIKVQDGEYLTYVGDVYTSTSEHVAGLQKALIEANDASKEKLENGLRDAKISRTDINQNNTEVLGAFSKKLPYTKIGTLENKKAYEFIVEPVDFQNISSDIVQEVKPIAKPKDPLTYLSWILGGVIVLGLIGIIARQIYKRSKKEA